MGMGGPKWKKKIAENTLGVGHEGATQVANRPRCVSADVSESSSCRISALFRWGMFGIVPPFSVSWIK